MSVDVELYMDIDVGASKPYRVVFYEDNMTHNVACMWAKAGCYEAIYEAHGKEAREIIGILSSALVDMFYNPEVYKAMNPPNGWGSYESAYNFLNEYYKACCKFPKAKIYVSR